MSGISVMADAVSPVILAGGLAGILIIIAAAAFAIIWLIMYIRKKNRKE